MSIKFPDSLSKSDLFAGFPEESGVYVYRERRSRRSLFGGPCFLLQVQRVCSDKTLPPSRVASSDPRIPKAKRGLHYCVVQDIHVRTLLNTT